MPWEARNDADVLYGAMAEIDKLDWWSLLQAFRGTWCESGCLVTVQGTPDGTVAVSGGPYRVLKTPLTLTGGNVSVLSGSANPDGSTAMAAHASQARFDLIVINSGNQLGVLHGTALLPTFPDNVAKPVYPPSIATNMVLLGVVFVVPGSTVIGTALGQSQIVTKDMRADKDAFHAESHVLSSHTGTLDDTMHGVRTLANAHAHVALSGIGLNDHGNTGLPLGLTGAVSAGRYVGATADVAPTTGTFVAGDWVTSLTGKIWVCTTGGSPGTWTQVGVAASGGAAMTDVATLETTTSTSFANLTTAGPAVTVTVPASGVCLVTVSAQMSNSTGTQSAYMGFSVDGATALTTSAAYIAAAAGEAIRSERSTLLTGLSAGSHTFTAKYLVGGGTGSYSARRIIAVPCG